MYKLFVMDVDGTLTDGKIYMSSEGEAFKAFDIKDGYGIKNILKKYNIKTAIITGRQSEIVHRRTEELGIDYLYQGVDDKLFYLKKLVEIVGCSFEDIVYIGDDVNDLPCMEKAGLSCCPADAHESVKKIAKYVTHCRGGQGAVREVIDMITGQAAGSEGVEWAFWETHFEPDEANMIQSEDVKSLIEKCLKIRECIWKNNYGLYTMCKKCV